MAGELARRGRVLVKRLGIVGSAAFRSDGNALRFPQGEAAPGRYVLNETGEPFNPIGAVKRTDTARNGGHVQSGRSVVHEFARR